METIEETRIDIGMLEAYNHQLNSRINETDAEIKRNIEKIISLRLKMAWEKLGEETINAKNKTLFIKFEREGAATVTFYKMKVKDKSIKQLITEQLKNYKPPGTYHYFNLGNVSKSFGLPTTSKFRGFLNASERDNLNFRLSFNLEELATSLITITKKEFDKFYDIAEEFDKRLKEFNKSNELFIEKNIHIWRQKKKKSF